MGLQDLQLIPGEQIQEELVVIPSLSDFETLSADDLESKSEVLILKHKLVMREGEHNGVYYSWEELKRAIDTGEGAGLYYDHQDSASNWVGDVKNLVADDSTKCIYGDIHVVDPVAAKKLRYGAKWGISPTIDAEKLVRDGKKFAMDPKFLSYSLVLRPAVRETMLNENTVERRSNLMGENSSIEELAQVKKEKDSAEAELKEYKARVEKYEAEELARKSAEVLKLGSGYGILSDADLDKLKELSDEGRAFLSEVIGRVASTLKLDEDDDEDEDPDKENLKENYLKFRVKFKKKNPKATEAEIKSAYAKLSDNVKKKKYPYPEPEKMSDIQERMKSKLAEDRSHTDKINASMLALMQEIQK